MNFRAADGDDNIYQDMPRIDWTLPAFPALPRPPPTLPYQNPWDLDYKYPGHYPQPDDHETIDKTQLYNDTRRSTPQPNRLSIVETTVILSEMKTLENMRREQLEPSSNDYSSPSHRASNNM